MPTGVGSGVECRRFTASGDDVREEIGDDRLSERKRRHGSGVPQSARRVPDTVGIHPVDGRCTRVVTKSWTGGVRWLDGTRPPPPLPYDFGVPNWPPGRHARPTAGDHDGIGELMRSIPPRPGRATVLKLLSAVLGGTLVVAAACTDNGHTAAGGPASKVAGMVEARPSSSPASPSPSVDASLLPGMPPPLNPHDLYAADRPGQLSPAVRGDLPRIYVPNNASDTVSVIDPATSQVIETVPVPHSPEHVVPSWDLRTLWVNSDQGNALTPIDAATGRFGTPIPVNDPYNLYFTPDGRYAVVMSEAAHEIVFRDAHSMAIVKTVPVNCDGVNHADFSPDGRYFIASCEFSGDLLKVDTVRQEVVAQQRLPMHHAMPQDVKIAPDGRTWYVADMQSSGVWILDGDAFTAPTFLATGDGAHGLYVSRDSTTLYISNRGEGSVSLLDFATKKLVNKWQIPGGGSPDMGGVSADGTVLWLSGRYHGVVYALSTVDGHLISKIQTGSQPHGLCVWPQPGRYSLGHTGILR
jgi:YVTN family beta-propeller protein